MTERNYATTQKNSGGLGGVPSNAPPIPLLSIHTMEACFALHWGGIPQTPRSRCTIALGHLVSVEKKIAYAEGVTQGIRPFAYSCGTPLAYVFSRDFSSRVRGDHGFAAVPATLGFGI